MKFGIMMKTYKRKKRDSKSLAERSLKSILNQTYQNYKVFLIGDKYEDQEEFEYIASLIPKDKIIAINLKVAVERDDPKLKGHCLWYSAGVNSTKFALNKMKEDGIIYYSRLDDDDYWLPNHLETIKSGYEKFPKSSFVYTRSKYRGFYLPRKSHTVKLGYNNLFPQPKDVVPSTMSWRLDHIDLPPRTVAEQGRVFPADADQMIRLKKICINKKLNILHMPVTTMVYDQGGTIMKGDR
jgi:glycosyltransferase involved in cell wall biosynthesis